MPLHARSTPCNPMSITRPLPVMVAVAGPLSASQLQSMDRRLASPRAGKVATTRASLKANAPLNRDTPEAEKTPGTWPLKCRLTPTFPARKIRPSASSCARRSAGTLLNRGQLRRKPNTAKFLPHRHGRVVGALRRRVAAHEAGVVGGDRGDPWLQRLERPDLGSGRPQRVAGRLG